MTVISSGKACDKSTRKMNRKPQRFNSICECIENVLTVISAFDLSADGDKTAYLNHF